MFVVYRILGRWRVWQVTRSGRISRVTLQYPLWCPTTTSPPAPPPHHLLLLPATMLFPTLLLATLASLAAAQGREFKAKFGDCGELAISLKLGLSQFTEKEKKKNYTEHLYFPKA